MLWLSLALVVIAGMAHHAFLRWLSDSSHALVLEARIVGLEARPVPDVASIEQRLGLVEKQLLARR